MDYEGPNDDDALSSAVKRAERLSIAFASEAAREDVKKGAPEEAWLSERFGELTGFLADTLEDWRREVVTANDAACALNRYLDTVEHQLNAQAGRTRTTAPAPGEGKDDD